MSGVLNKRQIGSTNVYVSELGMGGAPLGKVNQQDTLTSAVNQIAVVNRSGDSTVVVSQTGISGESLQVRVANNSGMSGATSFANSQTGISYTPIYYQIKWTENFGVGHTVFDEDNPVDVDRSNQITWTNNSVTEQQDIQIDFYNEF